MDSDYSRNRSVSALNTIALHSHTTTYAAVKNARIGTLREYLGVLFGDREPPAVIMIDGRGEPFLYKYQSSDAQVSIIIYTKAGGKIEHYLEVSYINDPPGTPRILKSWE
jgi:hypothetical protein